MPLLTRMVGTPLSIDIGPGAVARLAPLLADRRISTGGHVAVVVGPGLGEEVAAVLRPQMPDADFIDIEGGTLDAATALAERLHGRFYDAMVGIGGGRTLDTAKHAAGRIALPMVAVATNLAHDGIASPVSSLEDAGHKHSYGVQMPLAVIVDLDYVKRSEPGMRRSGIGDAVSNLSAIADWQLAERERGEELDGVAVTFARTAAMATAGSSRPCSGGEHEIVHAIDHLFPGTAGHGELAGMATLFACFLRGDEHLLAPLDACLARHGLPRTIADLGLTSEQFAQAVLHAPATRPDRYTVLEHLALDEEGVKERVGAFAEAVGG
jgi:glycerol-1-phosphate dehydrogenase [NAD(P)+]